jgi:hypothetical protein
MGGIDALLNAHFCDLHVTLLDGVDDPPMVEVHRNTFNDMRVAEHFLNINGVEQVTYIDANRPRAVDRFYDLIVSFRSWCFHFEPAKYLELVKAACHENTILILDVRRDKLEWQKQLNEVFVLKNEIFCGPKTSTRLYGVRQ